LRQWQPAGGDGPTLADPPTGHGGICLRYDLDVLKEPFEALKLGGITEVAPCLLNGIGRAEKETTLRSLNLSLPRGESSWTSSLQICKIPYVNQIPSWATSFKKFHPQGGPYFYTLPHCPTSL